MNASTICQAFPRAGICFWLPIFLLTHLTFADELSGAHDSDYVIFHWQVQDGLPSARIEDVIQTHDGYIWLATLDGLARFDGVRFERFYNSDTPGLANSMIKCLLEDSRWRLWYGTESGEIGWKDAAGFHNLDFSHSTPLERVERMAETLDGTVWAATRHTLLPINDGVPGTLIIRPENHDIWDICAMDKGGLWMLMDGGNVYLLDAKTGKVALTIPGQSGQWRDIAPAQAGGLWVRDGQCIRRWQDGRWVENRGVFDLQVTENAVIKEFMSGRLMIGTYGQGVLLLEADGRQRKLDDSSGLSQDQVLSLCEDREKNVWVGTVHGLNRLSRRVVKMIAPADNWQNRAVTTIAPANGGGFWVGTEGAGLYRIRPDGKMLSNQTEDVWKNNVHCVLEDASGATWTAVFGRGLRMRDKQVSCV